MVAGGAEATISPIGIAGFSAMFALSRRNDEPERASRPWDKGRDGFVCGEGAGTLVLETLTRAKKRGAKILAEVIGYAATSDAYHITKPSPNGAGGARAMRLALKDAQLSPEQIDYINAHGTSTPAGDTEESKAVADVFGAHATDKKLWVSSTKCMMGHLLGAAGAVEAGVCIRGARDGADPADDQPRRSRPRVRARFRAAEGARATHPLRDVELVRLRRHQRLPDLLGVQRLADARSSAARARDLVRCNAPTVV